MLLRAKTEGLFEGKPLSPLRSANSVLNEEEMRRSLPLLESFPRRLVFELTNACNLNCVMCGRNDADFSPVFFDSAWLRTFEEALRHVEEVTLMGWGEPTIHPEFTKILEILDQYAVRKYFCTNGMKLRELKDVIFSTHVDIIAISLDGADAATNNTIRRGSDFRRILDSLEAIVHEKRTRGLSAPYMNFVFTAMSSNVHQIPLMVQLASAIGLEEVKVVYLTAFSESVLPEVLFGAQDRVREIFYEAENMAEKLNVKLKLPHVQGEDSAGEKAHKDCFVAWRDFFLGSDGYVRPCMSTPMKFFHISDYDNFRAMWNAPPFLEFRGGVNFPSKMPSSCQTCYQSSFANWNRRSSFIQAGESFAPQWDNPND